MEKYRYIVVEGPIGVGKTSLARRLAEHLDAGLLLEHPEQNPFLARFYQDMERYALPAQLFFLFQRFNQLRELAQIDLFSQTTVSDFLLDKDPLFARLTLSNDELHLYQQIYATLSPQAPRPDLVIYLQAQTETLSSASGAAAWSSNGLFPSPTSQRWRTATTGFSTTTRACRY